MYRTATKSHNKNFKNKIDFFKNIRNTLDMFTYKITNHNLSSLKSFEDFVNYMYTPVDCASLSVGRLFFGLLMLIDIPEERGGSNFIKKWNNSEMCYFPLFEFLNAGNITKMAAIYLIMWIGALGITLGFKYKVSSCLFVVSYWYIFLLDKSVWNNHSYLYGLCGILFMVSDAHKYCSIDSFLNPITDQTVSFWNYFIIKFQFVIMYFMAGVKKTSFEWLSGYAMHNLSNHWIFTPLTFIFGTKLTDLVIVHWFTCIFDLTIAFWLIYKPTRPIAAIFCIVFHLMNSRLFSIGMFPWVCLAELPLFFDRSWPRNISTKSLRNKNQTSSIKPLKKVKAPNIKQKFVITILLCYCGCQCIIPFSYGITKGYNNWTNGIYGYSWDMMVHAWDTVLVVVKVVNFNGDIKYLNPYAYTDNDRWTKHPDLVYQFAKCINRQLQQNLKMYNFSVYLDVWCSLNGRFQQRLFDPNVDILRANWSPFFSTNWTKPLLSSFTYMRPNLMEISADVLKWSNSSDVLFVADFPNMKMDHYVSNELENVTLFVLGGNVNVSFGDNNWTNLMEGEFIKIRSGIKCTVKTLSYQPSTYMYTFINVTMNRLENDKKIELNLKFDIGEEILNRLKNYKQFGINLIEVFSQYFSESFMPAIY